MRRQFHQTHTVRYDECNCNGFLTPTAFLRYMQNLAAQDAADAQLSGDGYWVVKRTVISFAAPIQVHTRLALSTYGIGFTRITAQRGYEAHLATNTQNTNNPHDSQDNSKPIISARTLWVYVDPRGRPTRLPARTAEIWLPDGPQPQQPEPPIPTFPSTTPETTTTHVRFSDIDLARHLNNAAIVEMLDNASWETYRHHGITPDNAQLDPLHYDIEYSESPRFAEPLTIQSWFEPFPTAGQEFTAFQHITHSEKIVARAHSYWLVNPVGSRFIASTS